MQRPRRPYVYLVRPLHRARPFAYLVYLYYDTFLEISPFCRCIRTDAHTRIRFWRCLSLRCRVRLVFDSVYSIRRSQNSSGRVVTAQCVLRIVQHTRVDTYVPGKRFSCIGERKDDYVPAVENENEKEMLQEIRVTDARRYSDYSVYYTHVMLNLRTFF